MNDKKSRDQRLIDALGEIDDSLIDEAFQKDDAGKLEKIPRAAKRNAIIRRVAAVAALFVLFCGVLTLIPRLNDMMFSDPSAESSDAKSDEELAPLGTFPIVTSPVVQEPENAPEKNPPAPVESSHSMIEDGITPDDAPILEESAVESSEELQSELDEPSPLSEISE